MNPPVATHAAARVATDPSTAYDRSFFGHPRGLSTLFFTEMWERFSYYGMRALLILFMTAPAASGGLAMDTGSAGAIYGLYTSMVYMTTLPGGWIADRLVGPQRAVLFGGILIACGHFSMAFPTLATFYLGLVLIVVGTGLLKGNVSVIVGRLYGREDERRDAGYSIFYMGINIGAMISPIVCGYLGQRVNWHAGFAAAGVGMVLGLIQYSFGRKYLGEAGLYPADAGAPTEIARQRKHATYWAAAVAAALVVGGVGLYTGAIPVSAAQIADAAGYFLLVLTVAFFAWLYLSPGWTREERNRAYVIGVLFLAGALFWSAFEQAGSTLNLFADRDSHNVVFGYEFPSTWYQSLNSIFLIIFAPIFAWLWVWLAHRHKEPSSPAKFGVGLVLVGAGFALLIPAAYLAQSGVKVSPLWLAGVYLLHTWGELALSPVGLSAMSKLAPLRIGGLIMGVWFLGTSVGNYIGGRVGGLYESFPLPALFAAVTAFAVIAGLLLLAFTRPLKRLSGGVH
jgi:POT family proton-dependent oligopeptide transporter